MWFSRSGSNSRRNTGTNSSATPREASPSGKPLLEPLVYTPGSPDPSPTKSNRASSASPTKARHGAIVNTTPTIVTQSQHDYGLTEVPSRLSASSSAGPRPSLNIYPPNSLLQPPLATGTTAVRSKHSSMVNLAEEELEGTDRLFDPFSGKAIATLGPRQQDPFLNKMGGGSQLDISAKQKNTVELEDPDRQRMWDYLAKIRSLQAEVAAMHLAMDGHGLGDPWGVRPAMHSRAGSLNYGKDAKNPFTENASASKVFETLPKATGIAGDSDSDDERKAKKKKSDKSAEEFVELDRMFEKKQEALKAVTVKLRELSSVIRGYHELENPVIEPPPPQDVESTRDILFDSPARKVLPPLNITPSESLQDLPKASPRPLLAPIFTASPSSSLGSTPNASKTTTPGLLSPPINKNRNSRRMSLEMGVGGGRHNYVPPSAGGPGPPLLPSPPLSRASLPQ